MTNVFGARNSHKGDEGGFAQSPRLEAWMGAIERIREEKSESVPFGLGSFVTTLMGREVGMRSKTKGYFFLPWGSGILLVKVGKDVWGDFLNVGALNESPEEMCNALKSDALQRVRKELAKECTPPWRGS